MCATAVGLIGHVLGHVPNRATIPHQADAASSALRQQIALGRVGAPEEAAGAMLALASQYASYISGQAIEVTGGGWL